MTGAKRALKAVLPPLAAELLRPLLRRPAALTYAPEGWGTALPRQAAAGYGSPAVAAREREEREPFLRRLMAGTATLVDPAVDGDAQASLARQNSAAIFGYVLARAAGVRTRLSILDYGGGLGEHYWIARAMLPGVELEYHCKELPAMAEIGMRLSPGVRWHRDDACLEGRYDVVMFSSSLQYLREWEAVLRRAAGAAEAYLYLANIPTVLRAPSYVAVQRLHGAVMPHQQFNRQAVLDAARAAGLALRREFHMGEHLSVAGAPEQPAYRGWLFGKGEAA